MKPFLISLIVIFTSVTGHALRGGSGTVGPGNPAALFCDEVGGEVKIFRAPNWSESSFCILGEAVVEAFTLYKHSYKPNSQMAINIYLESPQTAAVQAEEHCLRLNGQVEVMRDAENHPVSLCKFLDNSLIEVGTLFNGSASLKNQKLNELLNQIK